MGKTLTWSPETDTARLADRWPEIVRAVAVLDRRLATVLRAARGEVSAAAPDTVALFTEYPFHRGRLEAPEAQHLIAAILSKELGRRVSVVAALAPPAAPERVIDREVEVYQLGRVSVGSGHLFVGDPLGLKRSGQVLWDLYAQEACEEPLGAGRGLVTCVAPNGAAATGSYAGSYGVFLEVDRQRGPARLIVDLDGSVSRRRAK